MKFIEKLDKKTLFWYIIIFFLVLYVISHYEIKLNILFGFIISSLLITYLYLNFTENKEKHDERINTEKSLIIPKSKELDKYEEIVDFLFSIQDFYTNNSLAYEDLIMYLDNFFISYREVMNNNEMAGINYSNMVDQKNNSLNTLQSIIFNMLPNNSRDKKLNDAVNKLDSLLNVYLKKVHYINEKYIYDNGFNVKTKLLDTSNIVPFNKIFVNEHSTFDIVI